jgi:hypothetical protein
MKSLYPANLMQKLLEGFLLPSNLLGFIPYCVTPAWKMADRQNYSGPGHITL